MGSVISMSRTPQAKNDVASVIEGNDVTINALANDLGGAAKSLYSVDQSNPLASSTTATLPSGAIVSIVNGQIVYDLNGAFEYLGAGDPPATDTFTYAIRLGDGTVSTATATVTVTGQNDPALIGGTDRGSVTEDGTLTTSGALTITDVDTGEAMFHPENDLAGQYGTLDLDAAGNWTYTLNNSLPAVQALNNGGRLQDVLRVQSADGTTHDITVTINGANETNTFTSTSANETFTGTDGEVDYFDFNLWINNGSDTIQNFDGEDLIRLWYMNNNQPRNTTFRFNSLADTDGDGRVSYDIDISHTTGGITTTSEILVVNVNGISFSLAAVTPQV